MTTSGQRAPLTRSAIVAAAVALADEAGIAAVTMRSVAGRLGYEVMSLYNHVPNKDALVSAMVESVASSIGTPPPDLAPLPAVRAIAMATRSVLVAHPWAAGEWLRHMPGPHRSRQMEDLLRTLQESELSPEMAHHGFHAVNNHVLGYTLQEIGMDLPERPDALESLAREFLSIISPSTHPHTVAHVQLHLDGRSESSFELVLDIILDGLARRSHS